MKGIPDGCSSMTSGKNVDMQAYEVLEMFLVGRSKLSTLEEHY